MRRAGAVLGLVVLTACAQGEWRGGPGPPKEVEGIRRPELVAFTPEDDLDASPSPDGRYLVFASEQNGNLDVWVRDFGTNSIYPLTIASPTDDFDPRISPDGKTLAFVSRRDDAKGDLFLVHGFEQEENPERLTDEKTSDSEPVFSPDGKKLYFASASGVGFESINEIDLDTRERRRISPTPGFDPDVSIDGRFLVYTAPAGEGGRPAPHLVAMRLSDSATRALTRDPTPEGFARFAPERTEGRYGLAYVRFADDDDGSGKIDPDDHASLWRIDVDLPAFFAGSDRASAPFPLTDGADDELFPRIANGALYFTQGRAQQDVLRLPVSGMFPRYPDPKQYFDLADTLDEPRKRWFAYRCALALTDPGTLVHAQALLRIGNLQLEQSRHDLARIAFDRLVEVTRGAAEGTPRAELRGIAETELVALDRIAELATAATPFAREAALVGIYGRLEALGETYASDPRVAARIELEMAEVLIDRGERRRAIEAFDRLVETHRDESFSAARAMLRRVELLGVAHDPGAIGEAYARVLVEHPDQREVVREASRRIVEVHLSELRRGRSFRELVDELRRLIPRYGRSPVRLEARARLTEILLENEAYDDAALDLTRLVDEARQLDDRLRAAHALEKLAHVEEARSRLDAASEAWRALRQEFGELPGVTSTARDAITRVNLLRADQEERKGDARAARTAYRSVIDNDPTQVEAYRRYLALSAQLGEIEPAVAEARVRVADSPNTPMARYAYGLALTYEDPPDLDAALEEIDRAIELNPQFVHAYITRGWIREMKQLLEPGFLDSVATVTARIINYALGELLDISISTTGLLEDAIEDYKTALRLNQESAHPDTEAEILINLGNGHYRLGETTRDTSNFRLAFERYLDAFRFDYRFKSPATEMVYYERFGRAAAWSEEWALSAMATRRAIHLAEVANDPRRLAQLYGNLALAYQQAGEEAYARDALERFGSELEKKKLIQRSMIAKRERARARLGTLEDRSAHALDTVLGELAGARRDLREIGEIKRDLPDVWVSVTPDASSALYGFDTLAELDLNLALSESAHRALGETEHADAVVDERLALTKRALDEVPSAVLGFGRQWPLALLSIRERLGLFAARAYRAFADGDLEGGRAVLSEATAELDGMISNDDAAKDKPFLLLDRGRLTAFEIERSLAAGVPIADESAIDHALAATATVAEPALDRVPAALTSTGAIARTASIAAGPPLLAGWARERVAVWARLEYARGAIRLANARRAVGAGSDLAQLIGSLDAARARLLEARTAFEAAARLGAVAGHGLGARVLAMALHTLAEVDRTLAAPSGRIAALERSAAAIARLDGDLDLETAFALSRALYDDGAVEAAEKALRSTPPALMAGHEALIAALFSRTASRALARGEVEPALAALDRSLAYRRAIGPAIELSNMREPSEVVVSRRLALSLERLSRARRDLAWTDANTEPGALTLARRRVAGEVERLRSFVQEQAEAVSKETAMRLFGRPGDIGSAAYELADDEGLLFAADVEGRVHLFSIETSSTGDPVYLHRDTRRPAGELRADLADARAILAKNEPLPPELSARIQSTLFLPVKEAIAGDALLLISTGDVGGPAPAFPDGPAIANLSIPSVLELVRSAQLVGVSGKLALAGAGEPPLAGAFAEARRVSGPELIGFREGPPRIDLLPGQARRLDERTPVEALALRAQDAVIVEAEVRLEPHALERSVILSERRATDDDPADAFERELPLGALGVPARILILADTTASAPPDAVLGLDLAMVPRGVATTISIPSTVPDAAKRRLIDRFVELAREQAPAAALHQAQKEGAAEAPSVLSAQLIGSPGLDGDASRSFAQKHLKSASSSAGRAFKQKQYREAVDAIERWIRLQLAAKKEDSLVFAYTALVGILSEHIDPPEHARAADHQRDLVAHLERALAGTKELKARAKVEEELLTARLQLGQLYSKAQDFEKAEETFTALVGELKKKGDLLGLGRAYHDYALHKRDMLEDAAAVELLERAIAIYRRAGVYQRKNRPREADSAVLRVAEIELNRLSDPVKAKRAFERAYRLAQTDEERLDITLGLARAARRRGDFEDAEHQAEKARAEAAAKNLPELELSALIEAANVSWYRGDYQRAGELCDTSLARVDELLERIRKTGSLVPVSQKEQKPKDQQSLATLRKRVRRLQIYALSVCGVTAMSQRDFDAAVGHLERARRIAEAIKDERELATQYNNLGRVYLEFGRLEEAGEAFRAAEKIDRRLKDRYALAYDLRNLGRTLSLEGQGEAAQTALETALEYSREVKDQNNELRARFALGELFRENGDLASARAQYQQALPIADRFQVKDLAQSIHRALGLMLVAQGDQAGAEKELRSAIDTARTITGRVAQSDFGPDRYAAFDDLIALLLSQSRPEEAFQVAEETRVLELSELAEDSRLSVGGPEVTALWRTAKGAETATAAVAALDALTLKNPRLARMLKEDRLDEVRARLPADAAILMYRTTEDALVIFALAHDRITARRVPIARSELRDLLARYTREMAARADVTESSRHLADLLLAPVAGDIAAIHRIAIVPHGPLSYVAFAALPVDPEGTTLLIDRASVAVALGPRAAADALAEPLPSLAAGRGSRLPIVALGAPLPAPGSAIAPLTFADKELELIREEYPEAEAIRGAAVTRESFLASLRRAGGVFHFAGHFFLGGEGARSSDPLGGRLPTSDGPVSMLDVLNTRTSARLVVLSACQTLISPDRTSSLSGDELRSLAQAFRFAGAGWVLATTMHVNDLTAALVMKHFYREARTRDALEALKAAQIEVRKLHPHPAWWATFSLLI